MIIRKTTTRNYEVLQITSKPFLNFGEFRAARERIGLKVERTCFRCSKKFSDTDDTYLAITTGGNKLFCEKCAKEYMKEKEGNNGNS